MRSRTKWYAALAFVLVAGIAALLIYYINKGVPAIQTASYIERTAEPVQATELTFKPDPSNAVPGMKLVADNDALALYFHPETTEFAVMDKKSRKVWRSNPENRNEDSLASPFEKESLSSQLVITYRNSMGTIYTFSNFAQSINRGQFQAESIENGIRITYTLGDLSLGIDALPKLISKQRMEEKVLSKLDKATADYVMNRYYPLESNPDVLERLDTAVERALVLKRMLQAFENAGYTEEDLAVDNDENGIGGGAGGNKPKFTIPLELRLDGGSLVVTVPAGQIEESQGYRIRMISLLGFFGAAGTDEQGYMLVPDGTGSLIYLNNGKTGQEVYAQRVYGEDENDNSGRRGQVAETVRLPVFGLKSGDNAWFAVIDQGDAIASINADISGRNNSYNNVYPGFAIRGEDELELYKGTKVEEIQLLTDNRYEGNLQVRYSFLSGKEASYSGMAKHYREALEKQGKLKPLESEGDMPFFLSVLGAVDKRKTFLGVPYNGMIAMTSFEDAGSIADRLKADGVSNLRMRYVGWFNGGMNHKVPDKVKVDGVLGGKKAFETLAGKLESMGGKLYPDVAFQHVYRDTLGFSPAADAARFVTREEAMRTPYNRAFNSMDYDLGTYYLMSPAKLPYYVDRFMDRYKGLGIDAVSLRDLGDLVHADYRVDRVIFRETSKAIAEEQLKKMKEQYDDVLIAGGNSYALPFADQLVNVPTSTSMFNITDEEVPFYQMVVHGYADYAGAPINLNDEQDVHAHLLRSIELGAAPHFLWSNESSAKLKFTRYDTMYSTQYSSWYDQAVDMYKKVNETLSGLRRVKIENHIRHANGVVEVQYENGISLYINYTDRPVTVNGTRIDAQNFTVGGESQ
ncbi:DUF5696 domain-containing protein [Paenibacillus thermotolerans]|uniref:DUF5696 domain-containing protein n=1 Tax=Paenibacillus thermotolerans TaxID=3027807 RepID=UPI0023682065|nr:MULTISPECIES: DUF5696 domain-containing protein [unclassified Paenibacillus]